MLPRGLQSPISLASMRQVLCTVSLALLSCTLYGCGDWDYDVFVTYSCLDFDGATGLCSRWQQWGEIKAPYGGCFPGDALLMSEDGPVRMADLGIGDKVLGFDAATGLRSYSGVRSWLHRNPAQSMSMIEIRMAGGAALVVSPGHMLALSNTDGHCGVNRARRKQCEVANYVRASDLRPGDALFSGDGSIVRVEAVADVQREGLYAPLTFHSNYFVGASNNSAVDLPPDSTDHLVLAHSFANVPTPQRYELLWHGLLSLIDATMPSMHGDADVLTATGAGAAGDGYLHPAARLLMRWFGIAAVEPLIFEKEWDVDVQGNHLQSRRLAAPRSSQSGSNNDDWMIFFMTMLQTTVLPPFLANRALAPQPRVDDFHKQPFVDDDDDSGITPVTLHIIWITLLLLCCCCACGAVLAAVGAKAGGVDVQDPQEDATPEESRPLAADGNPYSDDEDLAQPPSQQQANEYEMPSYRSGTGPDTKAATGLASTASNYLPHSSLQAHTAGGSSASWVGDGPPSATGGYGYGGPYGAFAGSQGFPGPGGGVPHQGPLGSTVPPYQSAPNPFGSVPQNPYDSAPHSNYATYG